MLSKKLAAAAAAFAEQGNGHTAVQANATTTTAGRPSCAVGVWRKYDVMVCTPLRLVSLLQKNAISMASVEYLVLDEADKLLGAAHTIL